MTINCTKMLIGDKDSDRGRGGRRRERGKEGGTTGKKKIVINLLCLSTVCLLTLLFLRSLDFYPNFSWKTLQRCCCLCYGMQRFCCCYFDFLFIVILCYRCYFVDGCSTVLVIMYLFFFSFFRFVPAEQNDVYVIHRLFRFFIVFLGSVEYVRNPYLRSKLLEVLYTMFPHNEEEGGAINNRYLSTFETHPVALQYLVPSLINLYVDIETTGRSHQFYEKFSIRRFVYQFFLLK